ncbi:MAG: phosphoadenosine phosphosulfate reductase family protein [Treponema sp.]|jgi:predicted phosphoadenosine phosphosulfate sulfurtransferase|nr:phosphoadenosine phosphosulfate reductase family protein [Treponema sp.]
MVIKREGSRSVVEAARKRIINAFSNKKKVYVSFSGGKDSLCLLHLVLQLVSQGEIDASRMIVEFIDEEAIFECIEKTVHEWRKKVSLAGGHFNWFCLEVKHFCCFNHLEEDESFICWDSTKKDVWIRTPPGFAILDHTCLKKRKNTYQEFLVKHNADGICLTGVRMAESIQRSKYMASSFSSKIGLARGNMVWPIYDWKDTDVWRYLYDERIDIPEVYLFLYQTGSRLNELRVSQFFSVDTAKSLVKMNEYYPDLMDRIIRREPNAYLAALYWDSEMFRRSTKGRRELEDKKDYKTEVFKLLNNSRKHFITKASMENARGIIQLLIKYGPLIEPKVYKAIHGCLIGGDPKQRTLRSLITTINMQYSRLAKGEHRGK